MKFAKPFYTDAYYETRAQEAKERLRAGDIPALLYLIVLTEESSLPGKLEIYPSVLLRQKWFPDSAYRIVGFAHSADAAKEVVCRIIEDVLHFDSGLVMSGYFTPDPVSEA